MAHHQPPAIHAALALLGATLLLLEVVVFRLGAATVGHEIAYLVAVLGPGVAALGAAALTSGAPGPNIAQARRVAVLSLIAAATWIGALLAMSWLNQELGAHRNDTSAALALGLSATWLVPYAFVGGALGQAIRCGAGRPGLALFATGLGAAAVCLTLPLGMWLGVPRLALAGAALPCVAAIAAVLAARTAGGPGLPWTVLVTGPLVVLALLIGDLGDPWLRIVGGSARLAPGAYQVWSTQGLLTVEPRGASRRILRVDGAPTARIIRPGGRQRDEGNRYPDVVHGLPMPEGAAVLVVATGAGRQAQMALDRGAKRIVALEPSPETVTEVMQTRAADWTGGLYGGSNAVDLRLGEGRAAIASIDGPFDRIVVVAAERFAQVPTRMLPWTSRLRTREAVKDYVDRLKPQGVLALCARHRRLPALARAAATALGPSAARPLRHLYACSNAEGRATLIVGREALAVDARRHLERRCNALRMRPIRDLEGLLATPLGRPSEEAPDATTPASLSPPTDERPFVDPVPPVDELWTLSLTALSALTNTSIGAPGPGPTPPDWPTTASSPARSQRATGPSPAADSAGPYEGSLSPAPTSWSVAVTGLGVLVALLGGALTLLVALLRGLRAARRSRASARDSTLLPLASLGYGAAMAVGTLATIEFAVVVLGQSASAWLLAIPLTITGAAGSSLLVDPIAPATLRRAVAAVTTAVLLWSVALHVLWQRADAVWSLPGPAVIVVVGLAALLGGALLGAPLAATMRLAARVEEAMTTYSWAVHGAGWAVGVAAAQLLARQLGLRHLLLPGGSVFVGATALLLLAHQSSHARRTAPPTPEPNRAGTT